MKISIRGKNVDVTPALEEHVNKKMSKLAKYFEDSAEAHVVMSVTREEHVVELTVMFNSMILRSEENTGDMYASIDLVIDKIEKQIAKYKTKLQKKLRQSGIRQISEQIAAEERDEAKEPDEPQIVKNKHFMLKPMTVEEAILQMNLLSHDFFVFNDADAESVSVVYRRKDGNYGLIEPEL